MAPWQRTGEGVADAAAADPAILDLQSRFAAGDDHALAEAYARWARLVRTIALRSSLVLACFVLPFMAVYLGEVLVVRLTSNTRGETPWRLLERYGLVFIPVFLGVLVARNLPIVGMWGWAAWDIVVATFTDFPGGVATVAPEPFIDPSLFFGLGVLALVIGLLVGAYTALQLSRRLYREERHALVAFGVHTGLLCAFVVAFVTLLALPPF